MTERVPNKLDQHISPPSGDGGIIFYGLPYCDATKLAMEWFDEHHLPFTLHDYKTQGIDAATLTNWCNQKGWEVFLNKRSTTWRSFDAATQTGVTNEEAAINLMLQNTSLIKRPVIVKDGVVMVVGVDKAKYAELFRK